MKRVFWMLLLCTCVMAGRAWALDGRLVDAAGAPIASAQVIVDGVKVTTDADGRFKIEPTPAAPCSLKVVLPRGKALPTVDVEAWPRGGAVEIQATAGGRLVVSAPGEALPAVAAEVRVTGARVDIPLRESPAATSVVSEEELASVPRTIGAEEALRLVPGVKVDNQADGERVHLSIRGQGILTERGIRGVKVLLDGLPLNDPTGFAPDLFDVDWATVKRVEVFRGPSSALYGGGAAGGVINIETRDGGPDTIASDLFATGGSYGFWKGLAEVDGTVDSLNYRVSASRTFGDGYRTHTAFHATNLYSKLKLTPSDRLQLTAIVAGTTFFNENAEGLHITWMRENRRAANPDALTFNELQRTRRATVGLAGKVVLADNQDLSFSLYYRHTIWKEAVVSTVQHRTYDTPGAIFQYSLHLGSGPLKHHLSLGADLDWQVIGEFRRPSVGRAREGDTIVSDQSISQRGGGVYLLDRIELSPEWSVMLDVRSDRIDNRLTDKLRAGSVDLSGDADFSKTTARIGAAWNPSPDLGVYASWGQGFLPPATEELANNPAHQGGFNEGLEAATSMGQELGVRGSLNGRATYDVAVFHLTTDKDFGRYRVANRPLETFYRNAGASTRWGLELSGTWFPIDPLAVRAAYTYSHFKYDRVKTLTGEEYEDTFLPNSPEHQGYLDVEYALGWGIKLGLGTEIMSRAYIDASNATWANAYTLLHPRVAYQWRGTGHRGELQALVRNATDKEYIAFTEPDPDGNSYQPAPTREYFVGVHFWLGE